MLWLRSFLLAIFLCGPVFATAVVDTANASSATTTGAGPLNFSHTASSGTERLLYVGCSIYGASGASATITGITYNGVALTLIDRIGSTSGDDVAVEHWRLIAPATGSNTVSVSISEAAVLSCGAVTSTGIDQTTPTRTSVEGSSGTGYPNPGTESLTPTSSTGDVVLDTIGFRYSGSSPAVAAGAGQTQLTCNGAAPSNMCMSTEGGASGTTTMSWTWQNSWTTYSAEAVALIPAAAASGGSSSLLLGGVGK